MNFRRILMRSILLDCIHFLRSTRSKFDDAGLTPRPWGWGGSNPSVGLMLNVKISNFDSPLKQNLRSLFPKWDAPDRCCFHDTFRQQIENSWTLILRHTHEQRHRTNALNTDKQDRQTNKATQVHKTQRDRY